MNVTLQVGPYIQSYLKVQLVWITRYQKAVLVGEVSFVHDLLRQVAMEDVLEIISSKVARNHVHMFISYRPNQDRQLEYAMAEGNQLSSAPSDASVAAEKAPGKAIPSQGYLAATIADEVTRNTSRNKRASRLLMTVNFQSATLKTPRLTAQGC